MSVPASSERCTARILVPLVTASVCSATRPALANVVAQGLAACDVQTGIQVTTGADVVSDASSGQYGLVLVAVRADQLAVASAELAELSGAPTVLFFGNNPAGSAAIPETVAGQIELGFPGVGGVIGDRGAHYLRIKQQPTTLPVTSDLRLADLEHTLRGRGFPVQRVTNIDGWLTYHAAFVSCVSAALYRCNTDPARLAGDRPVLTLMCAAVTEAFTALHRAGVTGLPRNLAVLQSRGPRPVAVCYWAQTMRSPAGQLCFAAHARHAQSEMRSISSQVMRRLPGAPATSHLQRLLALSH